MASRMVALLIVAASVTGADANAFLHKHETDAQTVSAQIVEQTLLTELALMGRDEHLLKLQEDLKPMYISLPKNRHGRLDASAVRYLLHRFFVQTKGWFVQGLKPTGESRNSTVPVKIMKHRVPSFIQDLLEVRVHGQGLELEEVAAFAATIEDLVHAEAVQSLTDVFQALRLQRHGSLTRHQVEEAVEIYLMSHSIAQNMTGKGPRFVSAMRKQVTDIYPGWPDVALWAKDLQKTLDMIGKDLQNPFRPETLDFKHTAEIIKEASYRFGTFQDQECRTMKDTLLEMEYRGTGRVRLSDFYRDSLDGDWQFSESEEYLRAIGALDESNPSAPSVVIPNYVGSQANCIASSSFYSVCCLDECEGLMGQLERAVGGPSAEPGQIIKLISAMHSDTIDAPRNLSSTLLQRLSDIAEHHGEGRVPLHGRLFAQWMHHAYPRECPYPHTAGTTNPMTPDEWMATKGEDSLRASVDARKKHVLGAENSSTASVAAYGDATSLEALPWMHVEELVVVHEAVSEGGSGGVLGLLCKVVLLCAFAASMAPSAAATFGKGKGSDHSDSKLARYHLV
jgi:hypothetical protein